MFGNKTLNRLERMLDEAIAGTFRESDYDETQLSRVEAKWKHFLGTSVLSRENLEKEKENVKSLVSDISHQTKTPMANMKLYSSLLKENLEAVENFKGSRLEKLAMLYCKQLGINYKNLSEEEFRWLIRILQKSKKMGTPISQRKKR